MPGSRTTLTVLLTLLLTAPLSCNPDPPDGQVTDPHGCRTIILPAPFCGDGVLDDDLGEECDDGPKNADSAPYTSDCNKATCGDGHLQAGEECDDGPLNADNAPCTSDCKTYTCGDGLVLAGIEQCDDGDGNAADASCTPDCLLNECGDGYHHTGVEECDDGPQNADDAPCTSDCNKATCGDGLVQAGVEECDDGNDNNPDAACTPACKHTTCGDGIINTPGGVLEECDDGNTLPGDGCSPACTIELYTVFLTSSYFTGNFGGLSTADSKCQSLASATGHSGTFRAWLSSGATEPASRFGFPADFAGHFVLADGTVIARGWSDLVDGQLDTAINIFEDGQLALGSYSVWTGTDPSGSSLDDDCNEWTTSSQSYHGRRGQTGSKAAGWTNDYSQPCTSSSRLYCFQVAP